MGRLFIEHLGGERVFVCHCHTPLTNRDELLSTRFTGSTGRAFLFHRVVNVTFSEIQDRVMITGRHLVRDVLCMNCGNKLGWMYEYAMEESQRYKEGKNMPILSPKTTNFLLLLRALEFIFTPPFLSISILLFPLLMHVSSFLPI
ncbi:yippee protein [Echinococcus multilocularis]|uniref:Protein yippee-like n=1 Tax=Echinococcus multilocularis TaxID=6211 RepID=A0A068Y3Z9_ECHMU|nr:yippee protein [Echinococcus multilocularis]